MFWILKWTQESSLGSLPAQRGLVKEIFFSAALDPLRNGNYMEIYKKE